MVDIIIGFSFCILFALEFLLKRIRMTFLGLVGLNKCNDDACRQKLNEFVQLSQQNSMEIYAQFEYRFNFYFMP